MSHLDVFNGDAFTLQSLTAAINTAPFAPRLIGALNLFQEQGINTTTATIEMRNGKLTLVPAQPRGAPGQPKAEDKRTMRAFIVPHLPQRSTIMADQVQNLRQFGTDDQTVAVQGVVNDLLAKHRSDLEATIEYHRMGAIKGQVLDASGGVLFNLFTEFGVAQSTQTINLATDATKTADIVTQAIEKSEDALDGEMATGYIALCSSTFFRKLRTNAAFEKTHLNSASNNELRVAGHTPVEWAGVSWIRYRGRAAGVDFIPEGKAYLIPQGVSDLFITRFAPADYAETVNTTGIPFYSRQEMLRFNKGVELESQSNPLNLCTRPNAIVELTTN
jgi:hypothetical protein